MTSQRSRRKPYHLGRKQLLVVRQNNGADYRIAFMRQNFASTFPLTSSRAPLPRGACGNQSGAVAFIGDIQIIPHRNRAAAQHFGNTPSRGIIQSPTCLKMARGNGTACRSA
jgi:hypothetical protein